MGGGGGSRHKPNCYNSFVARSNKKHHKIPRTYLQTFTDSTGMVWISNRDFNLFPQKPENTLTESDYYLIKFPTSGGTLDVETKYLNGIEGSYADIYRTKIEKRLPITKEEKARLAVFVASMMERQPIRRASLEKFFRDAKEIVDHLKALPDSAKLRDSMFPYSSTSISLPAEEFLKVGEDIGSLHTSLIPETVPDIALILFRMKWGFMIRPTSADPFMTSDNPCVMMNPISETEFGRGTIGAQPGFIQRDVEITLPLSPDIALFCSWLVNADCSYTQIDDDTTDEINRRTRRHAREIIGSSKEMIERIMERTKAYHSQSSVAQDKK